MILSKLTNNEIKTIKAVALDNIIAGFKTKQAHLFINGIDLLCGTNIIEYGEIKPLYDAFDNILDKKENKE